jgi:hypothetical protein
MVSGRSAEDTQDNGILKVGYLSEVSIDCMSRWRKIEPSDTARRTAVREASKFTIS